MIAQPLLPATTRRLDCSAALRQAKGRIPSLVTGVVRDSHLVWSGARGTLPAQVDPLDLQYRIGSITKTFVAVAVMRLRDEGLVRLDDLLDEHISGTPFGDRTLAHLLTHTGGIPAEPPGSWWERSPGREREELHRDLQQDEALDRPGRHVHYSNTGFALLGELLARVRGRDWVDVIDEEILAPLEMRRTTSLAVAPFAAGYAVHPHADVLLPEAIHDTRAMGPAGQLWSTIADLARWTAFLGGDTGSVLSPATLDEMCEPAAVTETATRTGWTHARGLGLELTGDSGRLLVGHGGSMPGFQAAVRVDRETATGTVLVMNCTTGGVVAEAEDPFDVLDECEPRIPDAWVPEVSVPAQVLEMTGSWFWGTSEGVLRILPDGWLRLDHVSGMVSTSRFRPLGEDTWSGCDGYFRNETLRVVRAHDGAPEHLDIGTFIFTRRPYEPPEVIPGGVHDDGWPVT